LGQRLIDSAPIDHHDKVLAILTIDIKDKSGPMLPKQHNHHSGGDPKVRHGADAKKLDLFFESLISEGFLPEAQLPELLGKP
jgi:hypothetical protein